MALGLTLGAVCLHLRWLFFASPLWRDEVATVHFAAMQNGADIWRNLAYDNFPPLFLVPLRLWINLIGCSDVSLRCFGFSIGCLFLVSAWVAAVRCGVRVPIVTLILVGLNPLAIRTIDAIRPYGLGISLMLLTTTWVWLLLCTDRRETAFIAAGLAVLAVQTLYQNTAFLGAVICAGICVAIQRRSFLAARRLTAVGAVAGLSLLVHLPHLRTGQEAGIVVQSPTSSLFHLLVVARAALGNSNLLCFITVAAPAAIVLFGLREKGSSGGLSSHSLFAAASAFVGALFYFGFLLQTGLATQPWYYILPIALVALCADLGLGSSASPTARIALVVVAGIVVIPSVRGNLLIRQTNVDRVAKNLTTAAHPEDLIVIVPWYCGITWNHYYSGRTKWLTIPPLADVEIHRYDLLKKAMSMDQIDVLAPLQTAVSDTLRSGCRVWVVGRLLTAPDPRNPPILPPAPYSTARWSSRTYETVWAMRVASTLQTHAVRFVTQTEDETGPISPLEDLPVVVFSGWRE